jgi:hypothetical protein
MQKTFARTAGWLLRLGIGAWLAVAAAIPAQAASVLPLFLDEIVDRAAVAFEGTCVANRSERDPATNLVVTYTTFEVRDALKGAVGTTYTIKQVGGDLPGEDLHYRVDGIPKFAVGEDYVVFLHGASVRGFSSPVGLEQGRFTVRSEGAKRTVANGRDFREMASRMMPVLPPQAKAKLLQSAGPVRSLDLDQFKQMVRDRLEGVR